MFLCPHEAINPWKTALYFPGLVAIKVLEHEFELILEKTLHQIYIFCSEWIIGEYVMSAGMQGYQNVQIKGDHLILNRVLDIFNWEFLNGLQLSNIFRQPFFSLLLYRFKLVCFQFSSNFIGQYICHMTWVFIGIWIIPLKIVKGLWTHVDIVMLTIKDV